MTFTLHFRPVPLHHRLPARLVGRDVVFTRSFPKICLVEIQHRYIQTPFQLNFGDWPTHYAVWPRRVKV